MALKNENLFSAKLVPDATQQELIARGSSKWNSSLGQGKTWVHLMSLADGLDFPIRNYTTYSNAYRAETNRPKITINNVKISSKGEYGTTREARIQLTIFSDEDLNKFAEAYLVPDMSVRVEFGWGVNAAGTATWPILKESNSKIQLDSKSIKEMQFITSRSPTYEGFQGRVTNWEFKLQPVENVWDVSLTLVGAADAVAEMSISNFDDRCNCERKQTGQPSGEGGEEEPDPVVERSTIISAALLELYEDPDALSGIKTEVAGRNDLFAETIAYPGWSRDETGQEDSSGFLGIDPDLDAEETFISWGTVEALISYGSAQPISKEGKKPQIFQLNSEGVELYVPKQKLDETNKPQFSNGRWLSSDPRVCILPGGGVTYQEPSEWTDVLEVAANFVVAVATRGERGGLGRDDGSYGKSATDCFVTDTKISLTKIMVSTVHLLKRFKEFEQSKTPLMQAITTLLRDISRACGGIWEFEVVDVSDQEGGDADGPIHIAILDANSPGSPSNNPFEFKATPGSGGFCRDISVNFKPTDAMKTQALYGGNGKKANDQQPPPDNTPCANRFAMYSKGKRRNTGKPEPIEEGQKEVPWCNGGKKCDQENEIKHPLDKLAEEAIGVHIDSARTYLESQKQKAEAEALAGKNISDYCRQSLLPFEFAATLTGIGGFRWGQAVTCDRLPDEIKTLNYFQVTGVEHTITPEDWTTTVKTIMRSKPGPQG